MSFLKCPNPVSYIDFNTVSNDEFKELVSSLNSQEHRRFRNLSQLDYPQYDCFISNTKNAGYAISKKTNEWQQHELANVFSMVTGTGYFAVESALKQKDNLWLLCYEGLQGFYEQFGFYVVDVQENWSQGGPDVLYMSTKIQRRLG